MGKEDLIYTKQVEQFAEYKISERLVHGSLGEALENCFDDREFVEWCQLRNLRDLVERAEFEHSGTLSLKTLKRSGLPTYGEAYRQALEFVFGGRDKIPHLQASDEIVPPRTRRGCLPLLVKPGVYYGNEVLSRLVWDGKQELFFYKYEEGGVSNRFYLSPDVRFDIYGVPMGRVEVYKLVEDPRERADASIKYFPYEPELPDNLRERTGARVEFQVSEDGKLITTQVIAPIMNAGRKEADEVVFWGLTEREGKGKTVVLNALYPEFLFVRTEKKSPFANNPDRPVIYVPCNFPANRKGLVEIGEVFAEIDMFYEKLEEGARAFSEYWENQSVLARLATGNIGRRALSVASVAGLLNTVASEDEFVRWFSGAVTFATGSILVTGLRKYGHEYLNILQERRARGKAFVDELMKQLP
ncbi:MAG: hypothetical protein NZM26_02060 [Patescibacteria group bacterium]|nr:hypothetical protein [Patescibacteria group bacterium]